MSRKMALFTALLMCLAMAQAAEWPEGCSPAQPYPGVPRADLTVNLGHIMLYPRDRAKAEHFCDTLQMYLPREDIAIGAGHIRVFDAGRALRADLDFADSNAVRLRPMTERELTDLMWGGGMCFEIHLPVSLPLGEACCVHMDEGCIVTATDKVRNPPMTTDDAWKLEVVGDYGVGSLYYAAPGDAKSTPKLRPEAGDCVSFDLTLGGKAKTAVVYSANDSIDLAENEYSLSARITGTVLKTPLQWGVVFLDEHDAVLTVVELD